MPSGPTLLLISKLFILWKISIIDMSTVLKLYDIWSNSLQLLTSPRWEDLKEDLKYCANALTIFNPLVKVLEYTLNLEAHFEIYMNL